MKQQKGKVIIELPRTPANAWLFEKRYNNEPVESEKKEKNKQIKSPNEASIDGKGK